MLFSTHIVLIALWQPSPLPFGCVRCNCSKHQFSNYLCWDTRFLKNNRRWDGHWSCAGKEQDFCSSLAGACFPRAAFSLVCSWTAIMVCIAIRLHTCFLLSSAVFNKGELSLFFGIYLSVLMKLDLFDGATLAVLTWAPAYSLNC